MRPVGWQNAWNIRENMLKIEACRVTKCMKQQWKWDPCRSGRPLGRQVGPKMRKDGSVSDLLEASWRPVADFGRHFGSAWLEMADEGGPDWVRKSVKIDGNIGTETDAGKISKNDTQRIKKWCQNESTKNELWLLRERVIWRELWFSYSKSIVLEVPRVPKSVTKE